MKLSYILLLFPGLYQCQYISLREEPVLSDRVAFRCGIYSSYLYAEEAKTKFYPDLGLVLANVNYLGLDLDQEKFLRTRAAECFRICEKEKELIRNQEEYLKKKLKEKKLKGHLPEIARELAHIETMRIAWRSAHQERYRQATRILNHAQKTRLEKMEKFRGAK